MDPGHKARKNPSDNADLGFQAVGPALCMMQLNIEGLSAAKRHIIESLAEIHHIDVILRIREEEEALLYVCHHGCAIGWDSGAVDLQ